LIDDTGSNASIVTSSIDFSSAISVTVQFSYVVVLFEAGEEFLLEISTDGGTSFTTSKAWVLNADFQNDVRMQAAFTIDNMVFSNNTVLRIRCNASGPADYVYIDDISIESCVNAALPFQSDQAESRELNSQTDIGSHIETDVFPNPTSDVLSISGLQTVDSDNETRVSILNSVGQQVMSKIVDKNQDVIKLDVSHLGADQLYFVKIRSGNQVIDIHKVFKI